MTETILNLGADRRSEPAFVARSTDPVILPQPYVQPADFGAQYPQPLDPTEILAMCEEITMVQYIPEIGTGLSGETWREMNSLAFTSGSTYLAFADGACPEEYTHNGANTTVDIKNIGAKKSLSLRDIMHSAAVASANWHGINRLIGPASGPLLPGASGVNSFVAENVASVKEKEAQLAMTLVLNGEDNLLINGNHVNNSLEFTGIANWETAYSVQFHTGTVGTGTFSASVFDRWLAEGCASPTVIMGHPAAIQEMMSGYFQLGFQGSQVIQVNSGNRVVPGFNFASAINTGIGTIPVVGDKNFARSQDGTNFTSTLYAMRMTSNGEPLVYRAVQVPLVMNDLAPGCTAVSFQVWKAESLIIKHACAHGSYFGRFAGTVAVVCPSIG